MNSARNTPAAPQDATLSRYGPVALVTGASDGIGKAFAEDLARRGYDLVLVARRKHELERVAADLHQRFGVSAQVLPADLSEPQAVRAVLEQTAARDIGLFVAAAGFGASGKFIEQPLGPELDMIDVNCRAVAAMTHAIANRLVARGTGGVVLMSSLVAFQGVPKAANYAATKAYIQSLAEGLRLELRPHGVDVVACAPGPIASGFARRAHMVMGMSEPPSVVARETIDKMARRGTVRPGRLAKRLESAFFGMPRWGRVRIMAKVMGGMARGAASGGAT